MSGLFNLWSAICTATGQVTQPSTNPNWEQLVFAVNLISKVEKRKLTLKYHPDKLSYVLGRSPTCEEIKMSTIAMSALNLLFSDGFLREQKSIMATMNELNVLNTESIKKYKAPEPPKAPVPKAPVPVPPKPPKEPKPPKKQKDPNAPKRKPTAYNNFVRIIMPIIKSENNNAPLQKGDYIRKAATKWNDLTKEQKASYA